MAGGNDCWGGYDGANYLILAEDHCTQFVQHQHPLPRQLLQRRKAQRQRLQLLILPRLHLRLLIRLRLHPQRLTHPRLRQQLLNAHCNANCHSNSYALHRQLHLHRRQRHQRYIRRFSTGRLRWAAAGTISSLPTHALWLLQLPL